jgi:hypothetical protein
MREPKSGLALLTIASAAYMSTRNTEILRKSRKDLEKARDKVSRSATSMDIG